MLCLIHVLPELKTVESSVQPCCLLLHLLCHALFTGLTSVIVAIISFPWVKRSRLKKRLGTYSDLPEHSDLSLACKRSLRLQPHQHKKRPRLSSSPFIYWSTSKMPEMKCVSESDLFEAFVRLVTLLIWFIWYNIEQNITLKAKHHSLTTGQWECPNNDEWDLFSFPASQWSAIFRSSSLPDMETGMKSFKIATCRLSPKLCTLQLHTDV